MKHILLTGGSGLIGRKLTRLLLDRGYTVSHLGRKAGNTPGVKSFIWDIAAGTIDEQCIDGVDLVIHLAGAGVSDQRWTDQRKKELIESRTRSIAMIYNLMRKKKHQIKTIISASATGYYGNSGDALMAEAHPPAGDFLARVCMEWEKAVDEGAGLVPRIIKFRTGVVLSKDGGALPVMALPIKLAVGSPLGSGQQFIPWIHWQDVVAMYLFGIETETLFGVYNMVAPLAITNKQLTQAIAKNLKRPLWLPRLPAFVLKLMLGEMSIIALGGTNASAQKIINAGFTFKYPQIADALNEIYA